MTCNLELLVTILENQFQQTSVITLTIPANFSYYSYNSSKFQSLWMQQLLLYYKQLHGL